MTLAFFQGQCFNGALISIRHKKYRDGVAYIALMTLSVSIKTVSSFKPQ
jgi:hypothetical protein